MDLTELSQHSGLEVLANINLEKFTTIRLANQGDLIFVQNLEALKFLQSFLAKKNIRYHLVGWGANQVLLNTTNTIFIKLKFTFDKDYFKEVREEYHLPASVPLNMLTSHAQKFGLKGWEVFTGIPASLGGAVCMNAGTSLGEIGELVKSVHILNSKGEVFEYICHKDSFSYRNNNFLKPGEIIVGATLIHRGTDEKIKVQIKEYLEMRKRTQPLSTKNCGSVFKNVSKEIRAGATIDSIGLKGFGHKDLKVSQLHANFVENSGNATANQFKTLVDCLKIDIERYSGHKFELEVKIF